MDKPDPAARRRRFRARLLPYALIAPIAILLLAIGLAAAKVADRVRVPGLLLFLGLGMLAGSEGIGGVEFDDAELTRTLGTIGLVLILFEGGLSAGWTEIRPVLGTAVSLATVGTLLTALITGAVAIWRIVTPSTPGAPSLAATRAQAASSTSSR